MSTTHLRAMRTSVALKRRAWKRDVKRSGKKVHVGRMVYVDFISTYRLLCSNKDAGGHFFVDTPADYKDVTCKTCRERIRKK